MLHDRQEAVVGIFAFSLFEEDGSGRQETETKGAEDEAVDEDFLQSLTTFGYDETVARRALEETKSQSLEAAVDYISQHESGERPLRHSPRIPKPRSSKEGSSIYEERYWREWNEADARVAVALKRILKEVIDQMRKKMVHNS